MSKEKFDAEIRLRLPLSLKKKAIKQAEKDMRDDLSDWIRKIIRENVDK